MKILRRGVALLKSNKAFADQYVAMTVSLLGIIMVMLIGFAGYDGIHQYSNLDTFADEMAQTVANCGKTKGTQVTSRYNQLSQNTGLKPTITYSANYYNSSQRTVQYGDTITVTAKARVEIKAFADLKIPLDLTVQKTSQSQQYWK